MFDRRAVFKLLAKAMITSGGSFRLTSIPLLRAGTGTNSADPPRISGTFEEQLQAEMTRLAARTYSEQGIPMILACENVVARTPIAPSSKHSDAEFAPAFRKDVEAWERLHPAAAAADVASLVELLADRDFARAGRSAGL